MKDKLKAQEVSNNNLTLPAPKEESENKSEITHLTTDQGKEGNLGLSNQQTIPSSDDKGIEMDSPSAIDQAERFLSKNYDFRINQVLGRLEFKQKSNTSFALLDDYKFNSLLRVMLKSKIKISKDTLRSLINSDFTEKYDPFGEYFDNVPAWDGTTDHIEQLAATVKTDDDEKWRRWFKKWIVAVVACVLCEDKINHTAIVFAGKQGIGKTTWMLKLVPHQLKSYYYSGIPNLRNKDAKIRMAESFLINLDEMDSLTASNTERLKEIITATEIKERRPYGYYDQIMPRRASFMGSVNNKQFLTDTTGNRRFLCFEVNEIDFHHNIDIDKVYAQAKFLLGNGFQYFFDSDETNEVAEHNEQFQAIGPVEEMILKCFEPVDTNFETPDLKLTATEIGEYLSKKTLFLINDANIQKIGRIMRKHEFSRHKHSGVYVYALNEKNK